MYQTEEMISSAETFLKHKNMAEVRKGKVRYSNEDYRKTLFVSGDDRQVLQGLLHSISRPLDAIREIDKKSDISKKEYAINVGKQALLLKDQIERINSKRTAKSSKINIRRYLRTHFEKDLKRIDEYIAVARVIDKKGADPRLGLTSLIHLGQGSESKDPAKRKSINRIIKENNLNDKPLRDIPASNLSWEIKAQQSRDEPDIVIEMNKTIKQSKELYSRILELNILITEHLHSRKDKFKLLSLSSLLKLQLRRIQKKCIKNRLLISQSNRIRSKRKKARKIVKIIKKDLL